ncbi:cation:proton antiporter [Herbiconiux sp. A18JL235]|uniref:Cation:proton antiporter n=1 Tax=Herbiconiux sp. A18JL235 TaxID=3152363 RepID=A0AB39BFB2_9MICO
MDGLDPISIGVVAGLAVLAPLVASLIGRVAKVPLVVFEIVLGIVVGPSLLGWVNESGFIDGLSEFGLAMLFFMAGNEIDFKAISGRPLRRASLGWLISLAAGVAAGLLVSPSIEAGIVVGIALTSTALGTIMPVLRDAGELSTPFGRAVTAVGAVGEFGPLVAISVFLSGRAPLTAAVVLIGFVLVAGLAIFLASRGPYPRLHALVAATLHTSGQFAVRLVLFVVAALVVLSMVLGLDMLLGAFAAGVLYRVLLKGGDRADLKLVESKLEGVAFGFLVPIFFIYTGVTFDLTSLLSSPSSLVLMVASVVLLLLVRGLPGALAAPPGSGRRDRVAIGLFSATGLPIIVAVTGIGVAEGVLQASTAAALVGAGMLSVLLFPLLALGQRKRALGGRTLPPDTEVHVPVEG